MPALPSVSVARRSSTQNHDEGAVSQPGRGWCFPPGNQQRCNVQLYFPRVSLPLDKKKGGAALTDDNTNTNIARRSQCMVLIRSGDPTDVLGGRRVLPELLHQRRRCGGVREEEPGCSLHELHHELTEKRSFGVENGK